jgi:hypothetical protein
MLKNIQLSILDDFNNFYKTALVTLSFFYLFKDPPSGSVAADGDVDATHCDGRGGHGGPGR